MQPVHSIFPDALQEGRPTSAEQARTWCSLLEGGTVLYFPRTPVPVPGEDRDFLTGQNQIHHPLHKNIAYKPSRDALSGMDRQSASEIGGRLGSIMRRYSASVASFLAAFLSLYQENWLLDYASYRPFEEDGRNLPTHRRNDLLHTDAFPTRPTRGRRILRFFHNIHPSRPRDWLVGEPFSQIVGQFMPEKISIPMPDTGMKKMGMRFASWSGLAKLAPRLKRTPYDQFMHKLHNVMKEDEDYQRSCVRYPIQFEPGSSWMVYTDTVPHAVLAGQFAMEQTFLVDPAFTVEPSTAPVAVLEKLIGARLI